MPQQCVAAVLPPALLLRPPLRARDDRDRGLSVPRDAPDLPPAGAAVAHLPLQLLADVGCFRGGRQRNHGVRFPRREGAREGVSHGAEH